MLDYSCAHAIVRVPSARRLWMVLSCSLNVGLLAYFKIHSQRTLPIGISFYTFQSLGYLLSVYRGHIAPIASFPRFLCFVSMFPHLVAGPLVRAEDILPQLDRLGLPDREKAFEGMVLVARGLFKKMVLGDHLGDFVERAFRHPASDLSGPGWWLVALAFGYQIYFDFSGYSDIARGLAAWLGVDFPINFNHPYSARSLREFWQRWHISLSTWFRDYLYIPLGGSRALRNLWITMLVSALWHGLSGTFVAWGCIHAAHSAWNAASPPPARNSACEAGA